MPDLIAPPIVPLEEDILANKALRVALDGTLQLLKALPGSRHRSLAITHIEDATMRLGLDLKRLGLDLKRLGEPNPYPNSRDVSNTVIDPTSQGLRF